ncbi:hypothetical protein FACS1894184_15620 [Clostridia bacterium]|nr:hypothetical protein FACS1894184_15620 [Clostridia bacterium]
MEAPLFEDIDDGKVAGWYGSTCKTERETEGNPPCKPACQFDDPRPEYCEEEDRLRAQVFEDLPDGKATGFVFPDCENRRMDPQACIEPCNPEWLEELEQAKEFLCPERKPFEDAPDGYLLRVETCKGASFFVTGWCQRSKSRRPGWTLCGGMHMYTKTCMRLNLCGGLKVSY